MISTMSEPKPSKISGEAFQHLVDSTMGEHDPAFNFVVESIHEGFARLRLTFDRRQLRPGGTIAGPVLFTLADTALFAAVLSCIGHEAMVYTTDMNIHFLRKPGPKDLIAECRIIKQGRQLMFGDVFMYSDGDERPVAHATGAYTLPKSG